MKDPRNHFPTDGPTSPAAPEIIQDTAEFNVVFVHSALDDLGLTPSEFRVYCHLARRAGSGVAWPSVNSMARTCRLSPKTVRSALKSLTAQHLLTREEKAGSPTRYRITRPSEWRPNSDPCQNIPGSKVNRGDTQIYQPPPTQNRPGEGNPVQGNPSEGNPHTLTVPNSPNGSAEEIYQAYPKKAARPAALRAIEKALKRYPAEFLLERVRRYALVVKGAETRYIPHPATWFNQERFNDPEDTWANTAPAPGGSRGPKIITPDDFKNDTCETLTPTPH